MIVTKKKKTFKLSMGDYSCHSKRSNDCVVTYRNWQSDFSKLKTTSSVSLSGFVVVISFGGLIQICILT